MISSLQIKSSFKPISYSEYKHELLDKLTDDEKEFLVYNKEQHKDLLSDTQKEFVTKFREQHK